MPITLSTKLDHSPTHGRLAPEASAAKQDVKSIRLFLRKDMVDKFVRKTPKDFIDEFLPVATKSKKKPPKRIFAGLDLTNESTLQATFVSPLVFRTFLFPLLITRVSDQMRQREELLSWLQTRGYEGQAGRVRRDQTAS